MSIIRIMSRPAALWPVAASLLFACTPEAPPPPIRTVNQQFIGRPVDDFFLSYGKPVGRPVIRGDEKIYSWVSVQPAESVMSQYHSIPVNSANIALPSPGSDRVVEMDCAVRIRTDRNDIVRGVTPAF